MKERAEISQIATVDWDSQEALREKHLGKLAIELPIGLWLCTQMNRHNQRTAVMQRGSVQL